MSRYQLQFAAALWLSSSQWGHSIRSLTTSTQLIQEFNFQGLLNETLDGGMETLGLKSPDFPQGVIF